MLTTIRSARLRRPRASQPGDGGYALLSVIGFGTAIVLTVGGVGGYAIQTMGSAGRTQGSSAAVQAAQAGVDDFVARQMADATYITAPNTGWRPVPGSVDGNGAPCVPVAGALPPNCPEFRHSAVLNPASGLVTVTSTGRSRGLTRAVEVVLKARAFTDYLYYSEIEAADPADRFAYPSGALPAGANCDKAAGDSPPRQGGASSPCQIPTWRGADYTDGSRVHTDDVFEVVGDPEFDSRVTSGLAGCAASPAACLRKTYDPAANPKFNEGDPVYDDGLSLPPVAVLSPIASAAVAGGCRYYGPTRIRFEGAKMRVWSPQTPYSPACGGGSAGLLNTQINVLGVTVSVQAALNPSSLPLGLARTVLTLASPVLRLTGIVAALSDALPSIPVQLNLPPNGVIYVEPAPDNPDDFLQCLLGSILGVGLHSGDVQLTGADCRAGNLYVDGTLDGRVTAGADGNILIMSDQKYAAHDGTDSLGLVAKGAVEVYHPVQCALAIGTCLSLGDLPALTSQLLDLLPGSGDVVTVEAAIVSLRQRFGVQLPVLSVSAKAALLNNLVRLELPPPTLKVYGSIAQRYRGIVGADLLNLGAAGLGVKLASADIDLGYRADYEHDPALTTNPPLLFPPPVGVTWDAQSFAEIDVPAV